MLKMYIRAIFFLFWLIIPMLGMAQSGVKFNFGTIMPKDLTIPDADVQPTGSVFTLHYTYERPVSKALLIQLGFGAGFSFGNWQYRLSPPNSSISFKVNEEIRVFHAELPLTLLYLIGFGKESYLYPLAGVQFDYMIFGDAVTSGQLLSVANRSRKIAPDVERFGLSYVVGLGARFGITDLSMRVLWGETDRYIHQDNRVILNQITFTIGWIIPRD